MNMDKILDFVVDNYIWFIVGGAILLLALIGYIADKRKMAPKKEKNKDANVDGEKQAIDVIESNETISNDLSVSSPMEAETLTFDESTNETKETLNENEISDNKVDIGIVTIDNIAGDTNNSSIIDVPQNIETLGNSLHDDLNTSQAIVQEERNIFNSIPENLYQKETLASENESTPVLDDFTVIENNIDSPGMNTIFSENSVEADKNGMISELSTNNLVMNDTDVDELSSKPNLYEQLTTDEDDIVQSDNLVDTNNKTNIFDQNIDSSTDMNLNNAIINNTENDISSNINSNADNILLDSISDAEEKKENLNIDTLPIEQETPNEIKEEQGLTLNTIIPSQFSYSNVDDDIDRINSMNFSDTNDSFMSKKSDNTKLEDTMQISYSQLKEMVQDIIEENEKKNDISKLETDNEKINLPESEPNKLQNVTQQDDEDDVWKF